MKTRNRWTLVLSVLVVVACVGWFVVSFTTKGSYAVTFEVFLYGDQDVEPIFSAASATAHRLGYTTADGTSSVSSEATTSMSLKAIHEDGVVLEIDVDSTADGPTCLRIRLTEKREDVSMHDVIDGTAVPDLMDETDPLQKRAIGILEAITASLESP